MTIGRVTRRLLAAGAALFCVVAAVAAAPTHAGGSSGVSFIKAFGWGVADGASKYELCTTVCRPGIAGGGAGQFSYPQDVTTDAAGNVYVSDVGSARIEKFDSSGNYLSSFGQGHLSNPENIAIAPSGNIYVANAPGGAGFISEFDSSGAFIRQFGTGPRAFGVALDAAGNVYANDSNNRIDEYTSTGSVIRNFGSGHVSQGGVEIGPSGLIYTINPLARQIVVFDSSGTLVNSFGAPALNDGSVPQTIAIDHSGNVYVEGYGNAWVDEFTSTGAFVERFGTGVTDGAFALETCTTACRPGLHNYGAGGIYQGYGLAIDGSGNIYVTDIGVNRVEEFSTVAPDTTPPVLSLPDPIKTEAAGPEGAVVTYTATATDDVDGAVAPSCDPASGSTFPLGTTTVDCSATDAAGNLAPGSFTVTVQDTTAPTITYQGASPATTWSNGPVTLTWACDDLVSGSWTTTQTLSGEGAGQSATGTCTDGAGNASIDIEGGVNIDLTSPTVAFSPSSQTYDVDQTVSITCSSSDNLSGVASDTCANVSGAAWSFGVGTHPLSATATDKAGNKGSGTGSFTVTATAGGVCDLVTQWVSNRGVANSLCVKLQSGALGAFRNELAAQSGKALTAAHAKELAMLSESL